MSITEFNNFNLYNQRPFLKKNSINTPENYDSAQKNVARKKHFEYGTPVTGDPNSQWKSSRQKGSFREGGSEKGEFRRENQAMTKYELDELEHKYQPGNLGDKRGDPVSQFHLKERTHSNSTLGRPGDRNKRKEVRASKRRPKQRSKSRTNWSKQRIQRELEKFEEEMEEESIVKKVHDIHAHSDAIGGVKRPKRSKRNSIKRMHQAQTGKTPLLDVVRKKKSRTSSRGSFHMNKGHNRRVSSQLEDSNINPSQKQKMVRSQVRHVYTARNKEMDHSLQHPLGPPDPFEGVGITSRNSKFDQQRKRYQMRYLQSSRDIARKPILKQVRQSYEQNYVPEGHESQVEDWHQVPRRDQYRQMNYKSHKDPNSKMNFDYRNLNANANANAYMRLPFE